MRTFLLVLLSLLPLGVRAFELPDELRLGGVHFLVPHSPISGEPLTLYTVVMVPYQVIDGWTVEVDGSVLRVAFDTSISLSASLSLVPIRIEFPALAPGSYTIDWDGDVTPILDADFVLTVSGNGLEPVRPSEGFWTVQGRPGTGLFVQQRGDTIGLGLFDHARWIGGSFWAVGSGQLVRDTVFAPLHAAADGSCIDCSQHAAPVQYVGRAVLMHFLSARRARATFFTGAEQPLVSLPFGADYVDIVLNDVFDAEFGPLPLPDLQGTWAFSSAADGIGLASFRAVQLTGATAEYSASPHPQDLLLRCGSADASREAGCALLSALETPPAELGFATLGNITESAMQFIAADGISAFRASRVFD